MKRNQKIAFLLALSLAAIALVSNLRGSGSRAGTRGSPAIPARTSPVRGLVLARPFELERAYEHAWRVEKPGVRTGWLLVLDVDPGFVEARQLAMPVLCVGDQTAECVNFGHESGRVIAIVPALDLASSPAWFAGPELAERVDAAWIASERARVRPEDFARFTAEEIEAALARGGETIRSEDRVELDRQAGLLILEHSPQEKDLANGLLVPVTR